MERALVRWLRPLVLRASRCTLLQRRAFRASQHVRDYVAGSSSDIFSRNELRGLSAAKPRPPWHGWRRSFASGGAPNEIVVPFMGDSVPDGNLASILKKVGDAVAVDEIVAQIETDKVTIDVRSTVAGKIEQILAKEGDTVTPGTKVAIVAIGEAGAASAPAPKAAAPPPPPKAAAAAAPPPPPPKAPAKAAAPVPPLASAPKTAPAKPAAANPAAQGGERRVAMTRLRKRVATRLKDSQNTFALLTTFNEIDMSNIMEMRSQHKDAFMEKHGVKLGFMSGFVKASVAALQQFPAVNAVIDGDDIIYRDYIDISIAVGTKKGLVVPVLRGVDAMNFAQIEKTINMLGKKANDGTMSIDEMAGGTFTISNGGTYGSLISTPIINPPQSAILGMHATKMRPMVVGKDIVARPMMYVALTYDHRLIDGREAVLFLRALKDNVEDPRRLLLDI